jgi:predicted transglutaminase-like cysteine proteinase
MKLIALKFVVCASAMAFAVTGCATAPHESTAASVRPVAPHDPIATKSDRNEPSSAILEQNKLRAFKIALGSRDTAPAGLLHLCERLVEVCEEPNAASPRWAAQSTNSAFVLTSTESQAAVPAVSFVSGRSQARPIFPVVLTSDRRQQLNRINRQINGAMRQVTDAQAYGQNEYWTLPLSTNQVSGTANRMPEGDCEDFALEKRAALINAGWPEDSLYLAVGFSQRTGLHAVLVVATDQGDLVLDNTVSWIDPVQRTDYTWIRRQASTDLRSWVIAGAYQRVGQFNQAADTEAASTDMAVAALPQRSSSAPVASVRTHNRLTATQISAPRATTKIGSYPQLDDMLPSQAPNREKRANETWQEANPSSLDTSGLD